MGIAALDPSYGTGGIPAPSYYYALHMLQQWHACKHVEDRATDPGVIHRHARLEAINRGTP